MLRWRRATTTVGNNVKATSPSVPTQEGEVAAGRAALRCGFHGATSNTRHDNDMMTMAQPAARPRPTGKKKQGKERMAQVAAMQRARGLQ